jgi:hypothetical protein
MAELHELRGRISSYAGYNDPENRYLADQQLRAWVGERVAALDGRLGLSGGELAPRYELLLRTCEFGDPRILRELEKRDFDATELADVYRIDLEIIDFAQRSEAIERANAAAFLDRLQRFFAERAVLIVGEPEAKSA